MQQKIRTILVEHLPEKLRGRTAFVDGKLVVSEELKGQLPVVNVAARARAAGADVLSVPASQFDLEYAMYALRSGLGDNEIQQACIDLIARAFKAGATDIHLINKGTYGLSRFRDLR